MEARWFCPFLLQLAFPWLKKELTRRNSMSGPPCGVETLGLGLPLELWLCFALIPAFWSEVGYDELLGSAAFVTSCPPGRMKLHGGPPQPAGQCH